MTPQSRKPLTRDRGSRPGEHGMPATPWFTFAVIAFLSVAGLLVCIQALTIVYELRDTAGSAETPAVGRAIESLAEFGRAASQESMTFVTAMLGLVIALHAGSALRADRSVSSRPDGEHRIFALLAAIAAIATGIWIGLLLVGGWRGMAAAPATAASIVIGGATIVLAAWVGRLFVPPLTTQIAVVETQIAEASARLAQIGEPERGRWADFGARCALAAWICVPPIVMIWVVVRVGQGEGYSATLIASAMTLASVLIGAVLAAGWLSWAGTRGVTSIFRRNVSIVARVMGVLGILAICVPFALDPDPVSQIAAALLIGWAIVVVLAFWLPSTTFIGLNRWSAAHALDVSVAASLRARVSRLDDRLDVLRGERRQRRVDGGRRIRGAIRQGTPRSDSRDQVTQNGLLFDEQ